MCLDDIYVYIFWSRKRNYKNIENLIEKVSLLLASVQEGSVLMSNIESVKDSKICE